jgi:two-component system, cell cycle response regulator DivK
MKKVLVVEDNPDTRLIYLTVLQHYGYTAVAAEDGADGIRLATEESPDLILMNLAMPAVDGISATAALRQDPRTAAIPIIACTGFVRDDGAELAEHAGVNAYLEKPCEPSRIVQVVERFIGPPDTDSASGTWRAAEVEAGNGADIRTGGAAPAVAGNAAEIRTGGAAPAVAGNAAEIRTDRAEHAEAGNADAGAAMPATGAGGRLGRRNPPPGP